MSLALLVTGAGGQLGSELVARARRAGDVAFARGTDRRELDLTDPFSVRDTVLEWARVVRSDSPSHRMVVLNAAGFTAVDRAEQDEQEVYAVNAGAPAVLAAACGIVGARLVQLSTDYVFAGDATRPYDVDDPTGPRSAYGRTKLAGELAVREILPEASYVVRTAWLYGAGGPNFVKTMAALERSRETVNVVTDQVGSPTWAGDLAEGLLALCRSTAPAGAYHATNRGAVSWHGFARAVFEELGADPDRVLETDSSTLLRTAPRPSFSVLSPRAWDAAGLRPLAGWRDALHRAFQVEGEALRAG